MVVTLPGLKFHTWLKEQINSEQFDGLLYLDGDEEKKRFRIPWNKKYTEEAEDHLFKAYTMYRGSSTAKLSGMKSKFRNTLSKCPYIDVVFDDLDKQDKNFKVMRFLEAHEIEERKKKLRNRSGKNSPQSSPGEASSSPDVPVVGELLSPVGRSPVGRVDPDGAEQLAEFLPQLSIDDGELDYYHGGGGAEEEEEEEIMEYSYVQDLFEPITNLHKCLQQLAIPLADLGKFTLSICYQGTVVHSELFDLMLTPLWILHGPSIEQYMKVVANKRPILISHLRPLQLPDSDIPALKEILDVSTLGFAVCFNYETLKLNIQRFSQSRVFERNCGRESKIDRNMLHEGFGYDSLRDHHQFPITESLKFEFTVGHSSRETKFPYICIRLQSAVTEKIEQNAQGGGHFTNQTPPPPLFPSVETSVERSVERVKREMDGGQ